MTAHDILTQEIVQSVKTMLFGNEDVKFLLHIVYVLFVLSHIVPSLSSSSSSTNCSFGIDKRKTQTFTTTHNNEGNNEQKQNNIQGSNPPTPWLFSSNYIPSSD